MLKVKVVSALLGVLLLGFVGTGEANASSQPVATGGTVVLNGFSWTGREGRNSHEVPTSSGEIALNGFSWTGRVLNGFSWTGRAIAK